MAQVNSSSRQTEQMAGRSYVLAAGQGTLAIESAVRGGFRYHLYFCHYTDLIGPSRSTVGT
jgi:hypothetical protein